MIRVLLMITVAGFVLSVASLSAAFAIGGPDALARGGWHMAGRDWDWDWDGRHSHTWRGDHDWGPSSGPQATRTLAWSGAERLDIELPADVRYVQAASPATVTVTGPRRAIDEIIVRGDAIRYDHRGAHWRPPVTIVVQAPAIHAFSLSGRSTLAIEGYKQDKLSIDVSGSGEVTAQGEAREIDLDLSGSGDVDLSRLKTAGADVDISGAADAVIAPTEWARLDISGMGDVRLVTNPPKLETDVSGSGRVRQEAPADAPPAPTPPQPPKPPKPGA